MPEFLEFGERLAASAVAGRPLVDQRGVGAARFDRRGNPLGFASEQFSGQHGGGSLPTFVPKGKDGQAMTGTSR